MSGATVALLGAGAGGLSAAVDLALTGHDVRLWNRNPATLEANLHHGAIRYDGVLGVGEVEPAVVTTSLDDAVDGADVAVVCLPGIAHRRLFADLADMGYASPLVLNPGHTGGGLHARAVFRERGAAVPPVAELSTLTYVARNIDGVLRTTGKAARVWAACLPGGDAALRWALDLFPSAVRAPDVLYSSLASVNLVLHPPGAVLGAAWVEATGGDFTFYVEGMTPGVVRVLQALDDERLAVARAFEHDLPPLLEEMAAIGTADPMLAGQADLGGAIRGGEANRRIAAPDSLRHRYYTEDLPFGVLPFLALARVAEVAVPTAEALYHLGTTVAGIKPDGAGLGGADLGLSGASRADLIDIVRGAK